MQNLAYRNSSASSRVSVFDRIDHCITKIRFGGSAVLTIQYKNYEITSADAVSDPR